MTLQLLRITLRRHRPRVAVLSAIVAVGLMVSMAPPVARADEAPNRWSYLFTGPSRGVRAELALGGARPGRAGLQNIYVSVGGSDFLDIIQVGARAFPDGSRRFFAAYGRGTPNREGSLYVERDLGPADRGWHAYSLVLVGGEWRMRIDGRLRLRVSDDFRTWTPRSTKAAVEAEAPSARLGGTRSRPARIRHAQVLLGGRWRRPAAGSYGRSSWFMGEYRPPHGVRSSFGPDWLTVWMR